MTKYVTMHFLIVDIIRFQSTDVGYGAMPRDSRIWLTKDRKLHVLKCSAVRNEQRLINLSKTFVI